MNVTNPVVSKIKINEKVKEANEKIQNKTNEQFSTINQDISKEKKDIPTELKEILMEKTIIEFTKQDNILESTNHKENQTNIQEKLVNNEKIPSEFPFPFNPYKIQTDFMKNLYYTLEEKKFGIFESPTGTGKSLSIICGILKWYYDNKQNEISKINKDIENLSIEKINIENNQTDDWILQQSNEIKINNKINDLKDLLKKQNLYDEYIENIKKSNEKRKQTLKNDVKIHALNYNNKNENLYNNKNLKNYSEYEKYKTELLELNEESNMIIDEIIDVSKDNDDEEDEEIDNFKELKIYFASRTHSQLSQFIKEIKKTEYNNKIRITCLSSRQNYCINPQINKLNNINLINEKCIELGKNIKNTKIDKDNKIIKKQKCNNGCIYKNQTTINDLKNEMLSNISDIEEIVNEAKNIKACPYYASRKALKNAQLIVLPYNTLLHKNTRESYNIDLTDSIIVIDEAHNLLDMIESIHSSQIYANSIYNCYNQLNNYKNKFITKFNSNNLLFINQIIYLLKMFIYSLNFKYLIEKKKINIKKNIKQNSLTENNTIYENIKNVSSNNNPKQKLKHCTENTNLNTHESTIEIKQEIKNNSLLTNNEENLDLKQPTEIVNTQNLAASNNQNEIHKEESKLLTLSDFLMENNIDNINIFKLLEFIKQSRLCFKLQNYSLKYKDCLKPINNNEEKPKHGIQNFLNKIQNKDETVVSEEENFEQTVKNPMLTIVTFLEVLINKNEDGRILINISKDINKSFIKYFLLNPANHFEEIVNKSRSIILAGGTMEPISEFKDQLFGNLGISEKRLHYFSCGHVIPKENILPIILKSGPSGKIFNLTYENRIKKENLNEIAMTILNICNIVPAGVVCFFPSYDYEKIIYNFMKENNFIDKILKKKIIFREPKKTSDVEKILTDYANIIDKQNKGALMLSVIGGKLSEGLNFSNNLGRCIIVIGMPYSNIKSLYLAEKIKYLNNTISSGYGQTYYKNLCMKGVNQSIGRAIRHSNDYACMILLDERYENSNIQCLLPLWIRDYLQIHNNFSSMFKSINGFFNNKKIDNAR